MLWLTMVFVCFFRLNAPKFKGSGAHISRSGKNSKVHTFLEVTMFVCFFLLSFDGQSNPIVTGRV